LQLDRAIIEKNIQITTNMAQRLKSWESPRKQGRNKKGKGGSARQRQLKKRQQMLRKKLKDSPEAKKQDKQNDKREEVELFPLFFFKVEKNYLKMLH